MSLKTIAAVSFFAALSLSAQDIRELTFQVAMPVKEGPVLDGSLDDACWKEAVVHSNYYEYLKPNPKRVELKTDCRFIYDDKGIYTGIVNWEKYPEKLRRNCTKNNQESIWTDDCAELYYDPEASGAGYYRFVINANGKVDPAWRMDAANIDWNWVADGIQATAKVFEDRWEIEFFIPWSAFHNRPKPEPGAVWTFNHSRFRFTEKGWGDFSTSAPGGSYNSPNKFGYLYFSNGDKPDAKAVLDLLSKRLQTIWAIQIGDKTYLRDLKGITTMDGTISEFIDAREAKDKAANASYVTNFLSLADADYRAEPIELPLAGTYDLNPPKEYDGYNGWFRHNRIKDAYITPHLDWRTPANVKKPKVLFFTDFGATFRDAIELEERFDMDAYFFPGNFGESGVYSDPISLGTSLDKRRQFETLLAKNPDVFVFTGMSFDKVPAMYRYEILRRVRDEGKGLALLQGGAGCMNPLLKKLNKDTAVEADLKARVPDVKKDAAFYDFGKGRIAISNCEMPGPWSLAFRGNYETRAIRRWSSVLWVAGVNPAVNVKFQNDETASVLDADTSFFAFQVSGKSRTSKIPWRLRNQSAEIVREGKANVAGERVALDLTDVAPGEYALDVLGDIPVTHKITKEAKVGYFRINSTNEILVAENAAVDISAEWEKGLSKAAVLSWEIYDMPYRQLRDKGEVNVNPGYRSAKIHRPAGPFATLAGFVRAKLIEDGKVVAQLDKMAFFPNHRFPDYTMTIWESVFDRGMLELLAPQCIDVLGYDNHLGEAGSNSAIFNGRAVPYSTRVMLAGSTNGTTWASHVLPIRNGTKEEKELRARLEKDVNIYKPEVRKAIELGFADRVKTPVKYGVSCWNLGDECHYSSDIGFGDAESEKYFREFLQKRYGTIEKFNAAHKTDYKSFEEAPHKLTSVSKKEGDWPSWGDQMAYSAKMYADTFELLRSVIKKFDPKARVGAEGSNAGDLEQTVANLEFWGPYRNLVLDEVLRNIAADRVRGIWWGGYHNDPRNGFPVNQWEYLLTGTLNGDLWFAAMPGTTMGAFAGDYTLAPYVQKMHANHSQLKRGLASLLIRTPFRHQPFAFYYSHASGIASTLSEEFPVPTEGLVAYFRFCYRYGHDVNVVTPRTLKNLEGKKLLFLSGACVLSDAEISALEAFVAKGGKIISDSEPGVLDEFFARRETAPLAGLWKPLARGWKDETVNALLAENGIEQQASVSGLNLEQTILRVRELDDMRLVGFKTLAKYIGQPVVLDPGKTGFVYEADTGFVGELSKIEIKSLDKPFKLYAVFSKMQDAPVVALSATAITAGDYVTLETKALRKGSVYRLMVKDANGKEIKNREQVFAANGESIKFQFPYSDAAGNYSVVLRDIATGLETVAPISVK